MDRLVKKVLYQCMGYRKGERVLLVTDDKLRELAEIFYKGIKRLAIEVSLICIVPRKAHGEEPPEEVASALRITDIAFLITARSLSHTRARQVASRKHGVRIASLPGITFGIFKRSIDIDYEKLRIDIRRLAKILNSANSLRVESDLGTNLTMSIKGRKALEDNGLYVKDGAFGNLPAGEICIAPVEGTTNGILRVDASFSGIGRLVYPIELEIKNGYVRKISDSRLKKLLSGMGRPALNIAEFGLGLNPKARVTGNVLEDEKTIGTAHIALGDNFSFGGRVKARCHLDGVFFKPQVWLNKKETNLSDFLSSAK